MRNLIDRFVVPYKWKKRAKQRKHINYRTLNIHEVLNRLCALNVPYVVLRPESNSNLESIDAKIDDIDILVDVSSYLELLPIVSEYDRKGVKIDIYGARGGRGLTYNGFPYYPPEFTYDMLNTRIKYKGAWRLSHRTEFLAFLYHLVFHKGPRSGLDLVDVDGDTDVNENYKNRLLKLAKNAEMDFSDLNSFNGVIRILRNNDWLMPYDLMIRLQNTNPWIRNVIKDENIHLEPFAEKSEQLIVFMLREDARLYEDEVLKMLTNKFNIKYTKNLTDHQIKIIARMTRGGNWSHIEKSGIKTNIYPYKFVVCFDPNPMPLSEQSKYRQQYPLVDNLNALYKIQIREYLGAISGKQLHAIHGSDNKFEAAYLIRCLDFINEYN